MRMQASNQLMRAFPGTAARPTRQSSRRKPEARIDSSLHSALNRTTPSYTRPRDRFFISHSLAIRRFIIAAL